MDSYHEYLMFTSWLNEGFDCARYALSSLWWNCPWFCSLDCASVTYIDHSCPIVPIYTLWLYSWLPISLQQHLRFHENKTKICSHPWGSSFPDPPCMHTCEPVLLSCHIRDQNFWVHMSTTPPLNITPKPWRVEVPIQEIMLSVRRKLAYWK